MEAPKDKELFDTTIAIYWFGDDGILYSISKNPKRTVENTSESFELIRQITNNKKIPLLVHLCKSPVPSKETRKFVAQNLPTVYTAMAMVSKSGLGNLIMNMIFRFNPPSIPMKSFDDEEEARNWLKQYL